MSQRCLEFDAQVGDTTRKDATLPSDASKNRVTAVRSRMPCGIGLHLNSLGGFAKTKQGVGFTVRQQQQQCLTNGVASSPACSAGSEPVMSVLDNSGETDDRKHSAADVGKGDECIQSWGASAIEDVSFVIRDEGKTNQSGRKRLLMDPDPDDGTDEKAKVKPRKRRRSSALDPNCKRCSCSKSKCLKLYCECFATGSYCQDSCGCRNCSNRQEHEDIVNEARELIQSRNPLAFAPRVISPAEPPEPAVAATAATSKHKKGCNCKKSMCLKKYCECYQAEVGCSDTCKCLGCKNTFGAKQGSQELRVSTSECSREEAELGAHDDTLYRTPRASRMSGREFESPVPQTGTSACSKSSSNFHALTTPLHERYDGDISPEFSASKTTCQRQLSRSSVSQGYTSVLTVSSRGRRLPPGTHSLQSKTTADTASSREEDEFPDFLLDPSEVQSATVTSSPKKKRVTPPQVTGVSTTTITTTTRLPPVLKNGRKLTLEALPSLPPVASIREGFRAKNKR